MGFNDINPFYREKEDYAIRNGHCRACSLWIAENKTCEKYNHICEGWQWCKSFTEKHNDNGRFDTKIS